MVHLVDARSVKDDRYDKPEMHSNGALGRCLLLDRSKWHRKNDGKMKGNKMAKKSHKG